MNTRSRIVVLLVALWAAVSGLPVNAAEVAPDSARGVADANIRSLSLLTIQLSKVTKPPTFTTQQVAPDPDDVRRILPPVYVQLAAAASTQVMILSWVDAEQTLSLATSLWVDADFRNTYDRIDNIGVPLGLAGAAVALIADKSNAAESAGWSLAASSVAKAIGLLWGNQTGRKFEEKAGVIEASRAAYNDLQARSSSLRTQSVQAALIRDRILKSAADFGSANSSEALTHVAIVLQYAKEVDLGFQQVRLQTTALRETAASYASNSRVSDEVREASRNAETKAQEAESNFSDQVLQYLLVLPRIQRTLAELDDQLANK